MDVPLNRQLTPVGTVKTLFLIIAFLTLTLALYFFVYVQLDHTTTSEYHINKMDTITLPFVSYVRLGFQFFVFGALALMFAHNFVISVFYFKARQSTFSNILKIIFNFAGCLRHCFGFSSGMLGTYVSLAACKGVLYPATLAEFTFLSSLALFILWRLRQIENKSYDLAIGGFLFFARVAVQLTQVVLSVPVVKQSPSAPEIQLCFLNIEAKVERALFYTYQAIDVVIDIYVTLRLIYILNKANNNAKHVTPNMRRPYKRSLFTAVMYWNFLRLFAAFLHYAVNLSGVITDQENPFNFWTYQFFALALLSYTITADAEVVRTIEGRPVNSNKGSGYSSSSGTAKASKTYHSGSQSPRAPSYKGQVISFKDDDDYLQSQPAQLNSSRQQAVYEDVSGQKVGVSMKRASFFEWASAVIGVRRNDPDEDEQYDNTRNDRDVEKAETNDAVEVILDERPTSEERIAEEIETNAENFDPERRLSGDQRRSSTFSGDTVTNGTTENNPVVHAL
ncbi:3927_t:CDS:2 [Paraglomus brasilianum]|uniref:3927_t:CDS:1 n=1 Tax=Paraglomus brasilianum TaxID=144538 RepID=A0A9N9AZC0_9GLOM|nr:3927_t:CDS:2 [Paraglomus brasilianum]